MDAGDSIDAQLEERRRRAKRNTLSKTIMAGESEDETMRTPLAGGRTILG